MNNLTPLGEHYHEEPTVPQLRQTVMLSGCGHWTQQERAREVNDVILEFLKGVELTAS